MQEDNELKKILQVFQLFAAVILLIHIYWYCHSTFVLFGWSVEIVNNFMLKLHRGSPLFSSLEMSKFLIVVFLVLGCSGTQGKKDEKYNMTKAITCILLGIAFLFLNWWLLPLSGLVFAKIYIIMCIVGYLFLLYGITILSKILKTDLMKDVFNVENESFMQETRLLTNPDSINLETEFYYKKEYRRGWINLVNPYRALMVTGSPGSGKSFGVIIPYIKQGIDKGYAQYLYDYKHPDLTYTAYNHYRLNQGGYKVKPRFYILNFDDLERTHRCNPINPKFMTDIADAFESSKAIMFNLNKTWITKQGDFFVGSATSLLAAVIWFLKIYKNGKYCTFPHAVEFLCAPYERTFPILMSYRELRSPMTPFFNAWQAGAQDQLQGQVASAQIPLGEIASPSLYWVMSGDNFTLDLNNPKEPKIICIGNNPDRQSIYNAALGLYNARTLKLINKPKQHKCMLILDEFPTIFVKGFDTLIATARSRKVAVCFAAQDFSQLNRDYGDKESKVIQGLPGSIITGQVVADTAKIYQERFGKVLQQRQSVSINRNDTSTSISTQMDYMIPMHVISNLSQGFYVGSVADDRGQRIPQKIFHGEIKVDIDKLDAEEAEYKPIPIITDFTKFKTEEDADLNITDTDSDDDKKNKMEQLIARVIKRNHEKIQQDVEDIIAEEEFRLQEK